MEQTIHKILANACFAPSGDNSQPWWFKVGKDYVDIFLIPNRDNPILNFQLSGSYLAHGCLIRNIEIAATRHSLHTKTTLLPDSNDITFVAHISFSLDDTVKPNPLEDYILKRCTNRKPYKIDKGIAVPPA